MFTRWIAIVFLGFLVGCVDLGRVAMHPQLKAFWLSANMDCTYRCLDSAATRNALRLEEDDAFSDGSRRFNLLGQNGSLVAWLDITPFGSPSSEQTSVNIFYGRNDAQAERQLMAMMTQCQKLLE